MSLQIGRRGTRRAFARALVIAAGLAVSASAPAQVADRALVPAQPATILDLRTGPVDTTARPSLVDAPAFDPAAPYVVQLDGPMTLDRRAALTAAGVELGQYLPNFAYISRLGNVQPGALAALGFVTWVGAFEDAWKLDPAIGQRQYLTAERQDLAAAGVSKVSVLSFDGADTRPIIAEIARLGGVVTAANPCGDGWLLDAEMRTADVPALTRQTAVQFVEDAGEITLRNDSNRWILQSNVSGQTPIWNKGIHGEGQMGGLIDAPPKEAHCMFDDAVAIGPSHRKFVAHRGSTWTTGTDPHGTHTAGTFAGDATPFNAYTTSDGMAFAAKLSITSLNIITGSNLQTNLTAAHTDGARVHSNSWGDDGTVAYTSWCRQIDLFTHANEDNVVAFAVSNGAVVTTPENSINVLAVGASSDSPSQGNHCYGGTGPTADGRRKPEVYAPGCNTSSANSAVACGVTGSSGTSMACPAVSGAGLLVRQYFTEGWYPTGAKVPANARTPSGALLRAALINSSVDMTGIAGFPSNSEGWGRVLLDNGLFFAGDPRELYVEDVRNNAGLSTGQSTTYYVTVNSSAQPLKVSLVFTGPAAAVNAANPVINNLDLEVLSPASLLYRGNFFVASQSAAGGVADPKNNVEQVALTTPGPGVYAITIRGTAVNQGLQGYALVATGDISFGCNAPTCDSSPSSESAVVGDPVGFTVAASGTPPLSYQWRKNGADIGGATGTSFNIPAAALADAGIYSVVVSNVCGSVPSGDAALAVYCPSDFNQDGFVDGIDSDQFNNAFEAGDMSADYNGDGFVDGIDYDQFNNAFESGC